MKKIVLVVVFFMAAFLFTPVETLLFAQMSVPTQKVVYPLPHPGMLPDNPLYELKKIRDSFLIFFTRDNVKKASVYLLLSDKKINMASLLAEKGKWRLAVDISVESQKDMEKALKNVQTAQKQGAYATAGFLHDLKLSVEKHQEVLTELSVSAPIREQSLFGNVLKQNQKIKAQISKL